MQGHTRTPPRRSGHHPCIVRIAGARIQRGLVADYGASGARLIVRGASMLPDTVEIMCMGLGIHTHATVIWRGTDTIGLSWPDAA